MDFFDKTTKMVKEIGNVTKEQTELANLKIQKAAIEKKLENQYAEKMEKAQKKYDNFEILKKIQMQYEMDIITNEEYEEKVREVLQ